MSRGCPACKGSGKKQLLGYNARGNVVVTGKVPCPACEVRRNRDAILLRSGSVSPGSGMLLEAVDVRVELDHPPDGNALLDAAQAEGVNLVWLSGPDNRGREWRLTHTTVAAVERMLDRLGYKVEWKDGELHAEMKAVDCWVSAAGSAGRIG